VKVRRDEGLVIHIGRAVRFIIIGKIKHEGRSFRIAPYRLVLRLQFQRAPHVRKVNNAPEINVSLKVVHHLELYRRE
jgi:hypothetical protein